MSTTTSEARVAITCPHWCKGDPQEHADDLWNFDGCVIHYAEDTTLWDAEGFAQGPFEPRHRADEIVVGLSAMTTPDGRPQADPMVYLDGKEVTLRQAEEIAAALLEVVALARKGVR